MVIPAKTRKQARIDTGDVLNILLEGDGRLVFRTAQAKATEQGSNHRRKGKHSPLSIGRPVSREEIFKGLEQFPP
jgi:bifunctional DNA-binding transcriptional regulator/antitoxin component of YhaV-PrlF toxin-antitoxin module